LPKTRKHLLKKIDPSLKESFTSLKAVTAIDEPVSAFWIECSELRDAIMRDQSRVDVIYLILLSRLAKCPKVNVARLILITKKGQLIATTFL
jgi:hypothetical protein